MGIKTPPGTAPLMLFVSINKLDSHIEFSRRTHELNDHPKGVKCSVGTPCQHIGFRVVDEKLFDAWLRSQTIRPNMHHIEHYPLGSFYLGWKEKV